jgi:tetratricopeptide (TPR) repeat protein
VKIVNSQGMIGWLDKSDAVPLENAVAHFSQAITANPRMPSNYQKRAYAYHQQGKLDSAIRDINEAIRLNFYDMAGWNSRGILHNAQKEYDKAIRDCTEAIALNPTHAAGYCNRGNAWLGKKDFAKASRDFTRAIDNDPRLAYSYSQRGVARFLNREYDEALEDFAAAEKLDSADPLVYWNRAHMLADCGARKYRDGKEAVRQAQKAYQLDPNPAPEKLAILAAAHAESGDFTEAIRWQERVVDALPESDQEDARRVLQEYQLKKAAQPKK